MTTVNNLILSFTEQAVTDPRALSVFCPLDRKEIRMSADYSISKALLTAVSLPYSSMEAKVSLIKWSVQQSIQIALRASYLACVAFTVSRVGVVFHGLSTIRHYVHYRWDSYNEATTIDETWNRTANYASAFFIDLRFTTIITLATFCFFELSARLLYCLRICPTLYGKCDLPLKETAIFTSLFVLAMTVILSYSGAWRMEDVAYVLANKERGSPLFTALALRSRLGIVSENGNLLPYSANDTIDSLIDIFSDVELKLLKLVLKANLLLEKNNGVSVEHPNPNSKRQIIKIQLLLNRLQSGMNESEDKDISLEKARDLSNRYILANDISSLRTFLQTLQGIAKDILDQEEKTFDISTFWMGEREDYTLMPTSDAILLFFDDAEKNLIKWVDQARSLLKSPPENTNPNIHIASLVSQLKTTDSSPESAILAEKIDRLCTFLNQLKPIYLEKLMQTNQNLPKINQRLFNKEGFYTFFTPAWDSYTHSESQGRAYAQPIQEQDLWKDFSLPPISPELIISDLKPYEQFKQDVRLNMWCLNNNNKTSWKNVTQILGLKENYTKENVRQVYKRKSIFLHPDKNPDNRQEAETLFKLLNQMQDYLEQKLKASEWNSYQETYGCSESQEEANTPPPPIQEHNLWKDFLLNPISPDLATPNPTTPYEQFKQDVCLNMWYLKNSNKKWKSISQIWNLKEDYTEENVQKTYKSYLRFLHPDRNMDKEESQALFKLLKAMQLYLLEQLKKGEKHPL
jgi:hypothetical protein